MKKRRKRPRLNTATNEDGQFFPNIQRLAVTEQSEDLEADRFRSDYKLEEAHDGVKYFRKGSKGNHVAKFQDGLMSLGFSLPQFGADGDFGSETQAAVKKFQNIFDLTTDGIVGPETMGIMDDIYSRGVHELKNGNKCPDTVGFSGTVRRFKNFGFFSFKKCKKITVTVNVKSLSHKSLSSCPILLMRIDNAERTKKTISVNMKGIKTTHVFQFTMKTHSKKHLLRFSTPSSCHGGLGLPEPEISVSGTIIRH